MLVTREKLATLIPHAGSMLMIDGVTAFDEVHLCCVSACHRTPDNPLRRDGRLSAHHGIEFAAQAAAIHGGLLDRDGKAPLRALAAVRQARFFTPWLDDLDADLLIKATLIMLDEKAAVYHGRLAHEETEIATMRLTLMTIGHGMPPGHGMPRGISS